MDSTLVLVSLFSVALIQLFNMHVLADGATEDATPAGESSIQAEAGGSCAETERALQN